MDAGAIGVGTGRRRSRRAERSHRRSDTSTRPNWRDATRTPSDLLLPLAEAKLGVPRARAELLQRPRLARTLDGTDGAALTLVSAMPGYGKTTAVRAWCASRGATPAWVTIDRRDNDPTPDVALRRDCGRSRPRRSRPPRLAATPDPRGLGRSGDRRADQRDRVLRGGARDRARRRTHRDRSRLSRVPGLLHRATAGGGASRR